MKKRILIEGMSCGHCVSHVKETLEELKSVINVEVNLEAKAAVLDSTEEVSNEDIHFAIDEAGYEVVGIEVL